MKMITVKMNCVFCGRPHSVTVPTRDYHAWEAGELIQKALPHATPTEREQLISGICPKCQDSIFDEPADIDDDTGFDLYLGCYTDDC